MSTTVHGPPSATSERRPWSQRVNVPDLWASMAIAVIWLAVLFDAVWGPDVVSTSSTTSTTIPSAVFVALFAWLATRAVAKYALGHTDPRT